ncbi:mandelate racemase/muconate lactonizing enzyme family protein [Chloroflexi bacterium TSY]|nr:mandelate racemase/muconate lactonizing enzyme family protein [Chloroflexi bacterium TSY]
MKIKDLSVTLLVVPLAKTFKGSNYSVSQRCTILVRVETDEGIVGEAYSGDERVFYRDERDLIMGPYRDAIIGEDLFATERIWAKLFTLTSHVRNKLVAIRALSAVDIALWDTIGKALKTPLYKLLGAAKNELPVVGYTYGEAEKTPEMVADEVMQQLEWGYAGTKLKVGRADMNEDIRRVYAIRQTVGDQAMIACDANRAWTPNEAIRFARSVEEYDIAWLEEPTQWNNQVQGMHTVRGATSIPVAAGQSELSGFACMQLMQHGSVDMINADASYIGGITEWKRMAAAASFMDVQMIHHEEPQTALHLLTSVSHSYCAELFSDPVRDPIWHQMYVDHPPVHNGKICPPDRPGLGIQIDRSFVEKYTID